MVADLEPFFDRVRALFPDTRGHGLSSRFERVEDYTYARKAEDLLHWLDGLGIREAVWGGASMGGALSLWLAVHAPERVRGVVSISGPPFEPTREDKAWWARQRPLVEAGRFAEYFDANVRLRMGEDALARLKARPDRYAELTGALGRHSVASLLALLDETYQRPEWLADCRRIRCPVQVIAGSADFSMGSGPTITRATARGQKILALLTAISQSGQSIVLRKDVADAAHFDATAASKLYWPAHRRRSP